MRIFLLTALIAASALYSEDCRAQKDWTLKRQKDGITVYVREVPGSGLRAFKAETDIPGNLAACLSVLRDIDDFTSLFPDCSSSKKVSQSDSDQVHYLIMDAPWPVNDRDGVFQFRYRFDRTTGRLTVNADIIGGHVPPANGMVRLMKGKGEWAFTPKGKESTQLVYTFHGEPGGSIPDWLADQVVVDTPFGVLTNFKKAVIKPEYQGHEHRLLE